MWQIDMLVINIKENVTAALRRVKEGLSPMKLNAAVGAAVVRLFQDHFRDLPPNKNAWPRQNYWGKAAKSTYFSLRENGVRVAVSQPGIRMHATGDPEAIYPVNVKKLTIPATAEAYGRRAPEFGNLRMAFRRKGSSLEPFALVIDQKGKLQTKQVGGKLRKIGTPKAYGTVIYWLVDKVQVKKYENVIPSDQEIRDASRAIIKQEVDRALKK